MVSSPKPALKAENKDRGNQEESAHAKTKRKRAQGTEEVLRSLLIKCGVFDYLEIVTSSLYRIC